MINNEVMIIIHSCLHTHVLRRSIHVYGFINLLVGVKDDVNILMLLMLSLRAYMLIDLRPKSASIEDVVAIIVVVARW